MTKHCWTKLAFLIVVVGAVLAAGDVLNRRVREDVTVEKPEPAEPTPTPTSTPASDEGKQNCTASKNDTDCQKEISHGGLRDYVSENGPMLQRTFYVLLGVTSIIVVYFVIRAVRIRSRQSRTKRYGVISTNEDRLEMTPLDEDDDDDEDLTVFEANGRLIK